MTTPDVRVEGPEALAAIVPTLLGFQPSDGDAVIITFTNKRVGLTLRVTMADLDEMGVRALARSVKRGQPDATYAVLIGHGDSEHPTLNLAGALWRAGLNLAEVLRVSDGQVICSSGCAHPLPEDPARAASVAIGRVVHESRDALYKLVEHTGEPLTDAETDVGGRMSEPDERDRLIAFLATLQGEDLLELREVYLRIARRFEPGDLRRDGALCAAAVASHLAGDTSITNVALDAVTPGHRLAMLLRTVATAAVPPARLREVLTRS